MEKEEKLEFLYMNKENSSKWEELMLDFLIHTKDVINSPIRAILLYKEANIKGKLLNGNQSLSAAEIYFMFYKMKNKYKFVEIAKKLEVNDRRIRDFYKSILEKSILEDM